MIGREQQKRDMAQRVAGGCGLLQGAYEAYGTHGAHECHRFHNLELRDA